MVAPFELRDAQHDRGVIVAAEALRARLLRYGFVSERYGVETHPDVFCKALLACGADPTAQYCRYQPDLAFVLTVARRAYFVEVKSRLAGTQTSNLSLELAAFDVLCRMALADVRVFIVFVAGSQIAAAYPQQVVFTRKVTDPVYLEQLRVQRRGSGTPFGIFPAAAPWLRPLDQFVTEELGCPPRS